jgi:predicted nucleic acid-binding protein
MLVLDTSAASAVMHGMEAAVARLRVERPQDVILLSPVAAEIRFGLERLTRGSRRRRLLEGEYARLRAVVCFEDWSEAAAEEFGRQKARLSRTGTIIEDFDVAIGSAAVVLGARLATLNARHMARLQGLAIEDWGS